MKNAHERFGWLEFDKQLRDTRTRIRVALDRFIGEPAENKEAPESAILFPSAETMSTSAPSGRRSRARNG